MAKDNILSPGDVVQDTYHIDKIIAAGGFAVIYAAHRISDREPVVIKALRRSAKRLDAVAVERFEREASVASQLKHSNNIRLFEHGRLEDGHLFLVMEHLEGRPLSKVIREDGAMSTERSVWLVKEVLGALKEAHDLGVVHRDLKPANIFLCGEAGNENRVKLLDYGFAKLVNEGPSDGPKLTQDGLLVGTPGYLAPEVCLGQAITPAADLYALGLVLFECLTGREAYPGKGIERAQAQVRDNPPPIPGKVGQSPLAEVYYRLTEREIGDRYQSADRVFADLERVARGESPTATSGKKRWWKIW